MGEKNLVCFSLVFLAAAVALLAGHAHGSDICVNANDVPQCRAIVKGATDPVAALRAAIEQLIFETKRANEASVALAANPGPLDVCKQNFDNAIRDLQRSLESLKIQDKDSLESHLSAALSDYVRCDGAVIEGDMMVQSVGIFKTDNVLLNMASNVIYLASLPWLPH
ncbi:uncharacterized protein LOC111019774 [Momordica charantia]|uniref:Uncharacterized protein LOC111019774 n=1 Tax=Momordica charantia TaxID=3673 RepID=A0A6J1DEH0_MOMCH|nr:uncharacterized protein LOC111019774 [Momordica charantia]